MLSDVHSLMPELGSLLSCSWTNASCRRTLQASSSAQASLSVVCQAMVTDEDFDDDCLQQHLRISLAGLSGSAPDDAEMPELPQLAS